VNRQVLGLLLGMGALIALSGAEIIRLHEKLDAKPAIEQAKESSSKKGPVKITKTERLIPQPDGKPPLKETVTVTDIASQEKTSSSLLKETPAFVLAPKQVRSFAYGSISPLVLGTRQAGAVEELGGGLIFKQTLGVSLGAAFKGRPEERLRLALYYFR
jgi:hypothetical protein